MSRSAHWLGGLLALIPLFGLAPLLLALASGIMASAIGCTVNEGGASGCIFMGKDIGDTLAEMFVAGWLMFVTFPAAGIAFVAWLMATAVVWVSRRRSRA